MVLITLIVPVGTVDSKNKIKAGALMTVAIRKFLPELNILLSRQRVYGLMGTSFSARKQN
jgi:hypothetical protein